MFAHGDIHHTGRKPFHGFQRVFNEIHRNEFELERIGQTLDVLTRRDRHGSMPAAGRGELAQGLARRLDQTHGFPHGLIGFCVSPYAVHNRVGASRLRLQFPGNGLNLFRGQAAGLNETLKPEDIERDSGERLTHLMGKNRRELPHCAHSAHMFNAFGRSSSIALQTLLLMQRLLQMSRADTHELRHTHAVKNKP